MWGRIKKFGLEANASLMPVRSPREMRAAPTAFRFYLGYSVTVMITLSSLPFGEAKPRRVLGVGRRLLIAFAILIGVFAMASTMAITAFARLREAFVHCRTDAEGLRLALELATSVRDQYAHQAHTIILGTGAHLPLYRQAHEKVLTMVAAVRAHATTGEERDWAAQIVDASRELDAIFSRQVVPAVLRSETAVIQAGHASMLEHVAAIEMAAGRLATHYEKSIAAAQAEARRVEQNVFYASLGFLLAAPLIALVVGLYVSRAVARPIGILRQGAERLASGDMGTRIEIRSNDEFEALANQFNAMTVSLTAHQQRLIESERLASVGRLAAGVAHEINNPLGVILGYARLLRKKADGQLAKDLDVIVEETLRCKAIVEGLLDLARPPRLDLTLVSLRALVEEAASRVLNAMAISERQHGPIAIVGDATVMVDGSQIRQILENLIRNAVEATGAPTGVQIEIAMDQAGFVKVAIVDQGPGVDAAMVKTLFEPFVTTKPTGMGLGLSISRSIARAHGGELSYEAVKPHGSRFVLRLPMPNAAQPTGVRV